MRPAGGDWQAPVVLSPPDQDANAPSVAVGARGDAVVVWHGFVEGFSIVQGTVRPAGGDWEAPVDLSPRGRDASDPQVAVSARGDAAVVWHSWQSPALERAVVRSAVRPAGGAWQPPVDLSPPERSAFEPQVGMDAHGNAVAVWTSSTGVNSAVQAAQRPAGGSWQAPVDLSSLDQNAFQPQLAVGARGDAVAVWENWQTSDGAQRAVLGAVRPAGAAWQAPVELSAPGQNAHDPRVGVGDRGQAVAVWQRVDDGDVVQGARRPAGGSWQPPVDLSGRDAGEQEVAVGARGEAVAVWARSSIVQGAVRPAGGSWQAPVDLSGQDAGDPQVAVDARGDAVAVWRRSDGANYIVQGAVHCARRAGARC